MIISDSDLQQAEFDIRDFLCEALDDDLSFYKIKNIDAYVKNIFASLRQNATKLQASHCICTADQYGYAQHPDCLLHGF